MYWNTKKIYIYLLYYLGKNQDWNILYTLKIYPQQNPHKPYKSAHILQTYSQLGQNMEYVKMNTNH